MSKNSIDPNDPLLTDYVLGELDENEHAKVERLLEQSPAARVAVNELLELSGLLVESFDSESAPKLSDEQRARITAAIDRATGDFRPTERRSLLRAARVPAAIVASVAAVTLVVVSLNDSGSMSPTFMGGWMDVAQSTNIEELTQERNTAQTEAGAQIAFGDGANGFRHEFNGDDPKGESVDSFGVNDNTGNGLPPARYLWTDGRVDAKSFSGTEPRRSEKLAETAPARGLSLTLNPGRSHGDAVVADDNYVRNQGSIAGSTAPPESRSQSSQKSRLAKSPQARSGVPVPKDGGFYYFSELNTSRGVSSPQPIGGESALHSFRKRTTKGYVVQSDDTELGSHVSTKSRRERRASTSFMFGGRRTAEKSEKKIQGPVDNLQRRISARERDKKAKLAQTSADQSSLFESNTESYNEIVENPFLSPTGEPLSTFSIDVDTASYSNMRRFLSAGQRPPRDAVRIEELINYFDYDDPAPADGKPFSVSMEVGACPWAADHRIVRVALKGREIPREERPPTNLVFLLDVSGSMRDANKLPLVKQAIKLLVGEMTEDDRIAIVTYAGNAGLVLDSTSGDQKETILKAIDNMSAGGSTNGEAGIHLAYSTAIEHLYKEGSNRVILCTDGDFNVGVSGDDELVTIIQDKANQSQVFLSVFGFGMGNLKDSKLESLADKGNGHYAYIDNLREAKKVFVEDLTGTLYTIAKDVKLQIEFNPAKVGAYRLIGYENRIMPAEHFDDDRKDAGEIGAGHSVTALYELIPADKMPTVESSGPTLKYQQKPEPEPKEAAQTVVKESNDLLTLWLRYKQPDAQTSEKLEFPLVDHPDEPTQGSREFQWTASVAAFGMLLRESQFRGASSFDMVLELAEAGRGDDESGRRQEFVELVKAAKKMCEPQASPPASSQPASPQPIEPKNPQ